MGTFQDKDIHPALPSFFMDNLDFFNDFCNCNYNTNPAWIRAKRDVFCCPGVCTKCECTDCLVSSINRKAFLVWIKWQLNKVKADE